MTAQKIDFLGITIDCLSFGKAVSDSVQQAISGKPAYVCFVNVHMLVESKKNLQLVGALENAWLALPDGMPIAKGIQLTSGQKQDRIAGMDFILPFLKEMQNHKLRLVIYGGNESMGELAKQKIAEGFPGIEMICCIHPPYRSLNQEEEGAFVDEINSHNPHAVFVILGCPKQEEFMLRRSKEIPALLLGLGGALPVFIGMQKRAPQWMQDCMLEWLFRFATEPRRLFKRYFTTNTVFVFLLIRMIFSAKIKSR